MKKHAVILIICSFILFQGVPARAQDTVMQVSTIDALVAGLYDGVMSCADLLEYGDVGIGTFHRLDGEMVVLDGAVYQVKGDGTVHRPGPAEKTPFAAVCRFMADETILLHKGMDYTAVERAIDASISGTNIFYAIKITGTFSYMKTRSVSAQSRPYPPLAEAAKAQSVFEMHTIAGTIVGFRCPPYVQGINVPGYHLHFISADRSCGGHILDFVLDRGTCHIDRCHRFLMVLPAEGEAFQKVDLSRDRSGELQQIEK